MSLRTDSFLFTLLIAGLSTLPPLCIDMNLPAIPALESAFQVAQGQGALTFSLFLLGFSIAPIMGGPLADRYGRRPTLLISLLFVSLAAFACMLKASFHFLLLARLIQGTAAGVCILIPLAVIRDTLSGSAARRKLSGIMLIGGLAPLLAPIIGSVVLTLLGWRAIYGMQGALGVILLVAVFFGLPETLSVERRIPLNPRQLATGYKTIFTDRDFCGLAFPQAFGFGCLFSYIAGSPGFLVEELHLSEKMYSLVFAGTSAGLVVGSMISGFLGRREVHARPIIAADLVGMVLAVCCILFFTWGNGTTSLPQLFPLLLAVMVCFGMMLPNTMSEAVSNWESMAGTASGAINSLQMFVGAGASALVSGLAGVLPPGQTMSLSMACSIFLAAGIYWGLRPKRDFTERLS
ncbi:MAG: multidrug effflux MFS transporter [Desulfovibrio sp.]|uniref:multidrug effflux MFS transporter n=1 Tax=Desulfovibrio sp. 7SRBS1 TaxID=3378064 RepID=UPI003B3DA4FF